MKTTLPFNRAQAHRHGTSGQSMIELMIGLIAVLAVFSGLLQVASLTRAHTNTMTAARSEAGDASISPLYALDDPRFIRAWAVGDDERPYTRDDEARDGNSGGFAFVVVNRAAGNDTDWSTIDSIEGNSFSLLHGGADPCRTFGLVRGHKSETVPLLPAVRSMLYRANQIEVETTVWMTWTSGMY